MKRLLIIILSALVVNSCVNIISYVPEDVDAHVIMNALLCAGDSTHVVYAGISTSTEVKRLPAQDGVHIQCYVNGNPISSGKQMTGNAYEMLVPYGFEAGFRPGDIIRIELSSNIGSAWAETTVPEVSGEIRDISINDDKNNLTAYINVEDLSDKRNYFMLSCEHSYDRDVLLQMPDNALVHKEKHFNERIALDHFDDPILDGYYLGTSDQKKDLLGTGVPNIYCIFSDRKFEESNATIKVSIPKKTAFSTNLDYEVYLENDIVRTTHYLRFSIYSISKDEFDYLSAISTLKINNFDASALMEDAVIPSNVTGGEGFVASFCESTMQVRIIP